MDIKLTEEQTQLQDIASKFMDNHCTFDFVRKMEKESRLGFCPDMWRQFADMGWLGMMIPEQYGGMGMNLLDTVVLIRELGRHICPTRLGICRSGNSRIEGSRGAHFVPRPTHATRLDARSHRTATRPELSRVIKRCGERRHCAAVPGDARRGRLVDLGARHVD